MVRILCWNDFLDPLCNRGWSSVRGLLILDQFPGFQNIFFCILLTPKVDWEKFFLYLSYMWDQIKRNCGLLVNWTVFMWSMSLIFGNTLGKDKSIHTIWYSILYLAIHKKTPLNNSSSKIDIPFEPLHWCNCYVHLSLQCPTPRNKVFFMIGRAISNRCTVAAQ